MLQNKEKQASTREKVHNNMIKIRLSKELYVYDVQGLCKSFYPTEQIVISCGEKETDKNLYSIYIDIELLEDKVIIDLYADDVSYTSQQQADQKTGRNYKNTLKKSLYELLSKLSGKKLPWGTLTGVRPSKLAMEQIEEGRGKEQVVDYMQKQYLCSREKSLMGYEIAKRELDILRAIDYENGYSLYIGIPFCPTRCHYCSFPSFPMEQFGDYMEKYLQALFKEIAYFSKKNWKKQLTSVYVGGGTPTTLSAEQLRRLLAKIRESFPVEKAVEFTVEAGRPDTITFEKLKVLKEAGVTRISINPQTMNEETLLRIGRKHTVSQVAYGFAMAREAGHDNINMDLIVGLPGEGEKHLEKTLDWVVDLKPDSLTVHSLVIKRASLLNQGKEMNAQSGDVGQMLAMTADFAKKHEYLPYYMYRQKNATGTDSDSRENVGYAKTGKESVYNIIIMEEKQSILALGAGASTKVLTPTGKKKLERVENVKNIGDYISRIDEMIERKENILQFM